MNDFASKNFVVVGGSKGIGLGIVKHLSGQGSQVLVLSRSKDQIGEMQGVEHMVWDATTSEFPSQSLPAEIHGLVYCPGSLNLKSFRGLSPEIFQADFDINVVGAVRSLQACLGGFKAAGEASVVLFSTVAVAQGMFAHASIAASKGAVEGLTRTLAAELAPRVRVNCIAPALTHTPMTERFFASDEKVAAMNEKYPLARAGSVDDMADAACFLLSEKSSWITGQVIGVDGGMSSIRK